MYFFRDEHDGIISFSLYLILFALSWVIANKRWLAEGDLTLRIVFRQHSIWPLLKEYKQILTSNFVRPQYNDMFNYVNDLRSSPYSNGRQVWTRSTHLHLKVTRSKTRSPRSLPVFRHFYVLSRTPPTVLIGERYKRIGMFLGIIRKKLMWRNFEF